jgi:D-xylose transport system permease protein
MRNLLPKVEDSVSHEVVSYPQSLWDKLLNRVRNGEWEPWPVVIGLILTWLLFQSLNGNFLTPRNLSNLVLQTGVVGTLGIGVVLVLLVGEIDLSLGAVCGVCASVLGVLITNLHWSGIPAMLVTLLIGMLIGLLQGAVTVYIGVPSFIVTLGGFLAWQGVQLILLGDAGELIVLDPIVQSFASSYLTVFASIVLGIFIVAIVLVSLLARRRSRRRAGLEPTSVSAISLRLVGVIVGTGVAIILFDAYFGIPYMVVLLLVVVALLTWMTNRSVFGRYVFAIGGNAEAARRAGIHVKTVRLAIFALASTLAALGGILSVSREFAVSTGTGGGTLLLEAIAAAVIGGTSLFGGRGQIYQALLGALVIGSIENGLYLLGQPASTQNIATGIILVIAVSVDALSRRRQQTS